MFIWTFLLRITHTIISQSISDSSSIILYVHVLGNFSQDEAKSDCTRLKTMFRPLSLFLSAFSQYKIWEKNRCIMTLLHGVHCAKGKNAQTQFTYHLFSWTDRQREGRTWWIEFHNFGTPLQMRCTSREDLRNFGPSYRQWSRYHITVCQVNTATHLLHWLTQMLWVRKVPISYKTLKISHSESHCGLVR